MNYPIDTSDVASLIQADWHEEFGDIEIANRIREEVTHPKVNDWYYESYTVAAAVGTRAVIGCSGGVGAGSPKVGGGINRTYVQTVGGGMRSEAGGGGHPGVGA